MVGRRDVGGNRQTDVCSGTLDLGSTCRQFVPEFGSGNLSVIGSEPSGLWTVTDAPGSTVLTLNMGHQTRELNLPSPWHAADAGFMPWDTGAQLVGALGERMFLLDRDGAIVLQKLPDLPVLSVTSRWAALRGPGTSVLFYRR